MHIIIIKIKWICIYISWIYIYVYIQYKSKKDIQVLNLDKIQEYIDMGRFVPNPNGLNNIRDLYNCGLVSQVKEGVKLLAKVSVLLLS